jgi:acetolactate synthase I/II/III large subunit
MTAYQPDHADNDPTLPSVRVRPYPYPRPGIATLGITAAPTCAHPPIASIASVAPAAEQMPAQAPTQASHHAPHHAGQLAGHLLVQCLIEQGVTHAFGVPGESYLPVLDGLHEYREHIRFITCRHEGGAAFMAEAAGKLSGRPGVCLVTRGPGATNAAIGLHTAYQDSTPMLLLVGDVGSRMRDREAFQEMDFFSFFKPIAKRVERIDEAARIPEYVARAFATAMNGRPGPVVLILPEDMLTQSTHAPPLPLVEAVQAWSDPGALRSLRSLLLQSERPMVIAGGGGWTPQAAQALQRFAENWQLPVANAFRFQDIFDNHHPQYAGDVGIGLNPALAARIQSSDLVIALGPRLGEMTTGGYELLQAPRPAQKLVHIHASAEELGRVYQTDLAICATMNAAARSLEVLTAPVHVPWAAHTAQAQTDYQTWLQPQSLPGLPFDTDGGPQGCLNLPLVIKLLQKHLPPEAVLTNGAGNYASWLHRYFSYTGMAQGRKTQLAPTSGSMGVGVPAGVAAALLTGRVAVTLAGDGEFLMTGQELSTAVQHGAATIVIVLNNGVYGTIRMHQEREYPQRELGSAIRGADRGADFVQLARGYGYHGQRVEHSDQFEPALVQALERLQRERQGSVIELMLSPEVITTRASLSAIRNAAISAAASAMPK